MIRLEVEPYCQECQDFEADVERPECNLFFGTDPDGKKDRTPHMQRYGHSMQISKPLQKIE